jgi:hypothetical protein
MEHRSTRQTTKQDRPGQAPLSAGCLVLHVGKIPDARCRKLLFGAVFLPRREIKRAVRYTELGLNVFGETDADQSNRDILGPLTPTERTSWSGPTPDFLLGCLSAARNRGKSPRVAHAGRPRGTGAAPPC